MQHIYYQVASHFCDPAGKLDDCFVFTVIYFYIRTSSDFQNATTPLHLIVSYLYSAWQHFYRVNYRVKCHCQSNLFAKDPTPEKMGQALFFFNTAIRKQKGHS